MGKTVIITGAGTGIGAATATLFAQAGYQVVLAYHSSRQQALGLAKELSAMGAAALALPVDVTSPADWAALVEQTIAIFGGVDILVNNAGIAQQKLFTDVTGEDWQQMLAVNLTGVFNGCQAVLPHMIRQKAGSILNVSSIWGICGASCEVAYSAAKAGVIGLTKALAKEVGPSGIRVNCVAPGVVADTAMSDSLTADTLQALAEESPLEALGTAHDIACSILFLAANDGARYITGQVLSPNGGMVI